MSGSLESGAISVAKKKTIKVRATLLLSQNFFSLTGGQKVTYKRLLSSPGASDTYSDIPPPPPWVVAPPRPQAPTPPKLISQCDVFAQVSHALIQESGAVSLQYYHASHVVLS